MWCRCTILLISFLLVGCAATGPSGAIISHGQYHCTAWDVKSNQHFTGVGITEPIAKRRAGGACVARTGSRDCYIKDCTYSGGGSGEWVCLVKNKVNGRVFEGKSVLHSHARNYARFHCGQDSEPEDCLRPMCEFRHLQ